MRQRLGRLGLWPSLIIALSCTAFLALGAPPGGITWVIWIAFAPLALVVRLSQFSPRQAAFIGWFGGLGAGLFGFPWMAELLERFAGFPWWLSVVSLFVFSAWTAVQYGLWALALRFGPQGGWRGVGWSVVSWIALAGTWPALFPYTAVLGLAESPVWMQAAELGGTPLVEAQVIAVGVLLADAMVATTARGRWGSVATAASIIVASTALGAWRMDVLDAQAAQARRVQFGVVQPNTPLRWPDQRAKVDRLRDTSRRAQEAGAQVVLWPEAGVYPYLARRPFLHDFDEPAKKILAEHDVPTIFGAPSRSRGQRFGYNTVFNMDRQGRVLGYFDKVHLMPFGEFIPLVDPDWAKSKIPALNHNFAGKGPVQFVVRPAARDGSGVEAPIRVGPLICYEDIFPDFARKVAAMDGGLEVFANLTIDTWFGDTAEPWEHLALAQFRSVEHRIPMVRSVSTGPSTVIDHNGRVTASLPVHAPTPESLVPPEFFVEPVILMRNTVAEPTLYARGGWLLLPLCRLFLAGAVLLWVLRRLRRVRGARVTKPTAT